jgi:hypothetical protein
MGYTAFITRVTSKEDYDKAVASVRAHNEAEMKEMGKFSVEKLMIIDPARLHIANEMREAGLLVEASIDTQWTRGADLYDTGVLIQDPDGGIWLEALTDAMGASTTCFFERNYPGMWISCCSVDKPEWFNDAKVLSKPEPFRQLFRKNKKLFK